MSDTEAAAVRAEIIRWAEGKGGAERNAALLLVRHDEWLHRPDFLAACTRVLRLPSETRRMIRWTEVRTFAYRSPAGPSTHTGILRLAADLATDDYRLTRLGAQDRNLVLDAVAGILGLGHLVPEETAQDSRRD